MDPFGRLTRRPERQMAPFLYAGIQLCHPRLFRDTPKGAFSTNLVWDRAIEEGRLYGIRHDGEWYHVSTPAHLQEVERNLTDHGWRF
jgi:N-acetyl-alpha-D-muramate 1-phosphate uridylyltransferase